MAMPRPPKPATPPEMSKNASNQVDNAIDVYLKTAFNKDLDYIAKFKGGEYKRHLELVAAFIKEVLMKDAVYFRRFFTRENREALKINLDAIIVFLKETQKIEPDFLTKFAAGELKNRVEVFAKLQREINERTPELLSQLAAGKFNFIIPAILTHSSKFSAGELNLQFNAEAFAALLRHTFLKADAGLLSQAAEGEVDFLILAIAIYLREITKQNSKALPNMSEGKSNFLSGRFFHDLKVDAKDLDNQTLVEHVMALDPFFIASLEKIRTIYSVRLSKDSESHLVKIFEIKTSLRKRLADLTKTGAWAEIKFGEFGTPDTLLNLFTTCICHRMVSLLADELRDTAFQELTLVLLKNTTLADVHKQQEALAKRKSVMLETVAGTNVEDFDQTIAVLRKTIQDAGNFQQLKPEDIFNLNEKFKEKLSDLFPLANNKHKAQAVVELILLIVTLVETKYEIIRFTGKLLPSTHGLMSNIRRIHNALALQKNENFDESVKRLKTMIDTVMAMESSPRSSSSSLLPPTPPVTKSVPLVSAVPKLSVFASSQPNQSQTVREVKSKKDDKKEKREKRPK